MGVQVRSHNFSDISGRHFNSLSVIDVAEYRNGSLYWNCLCDCGNPCVVRGCSIKSGNTKSCGCKKHNPDNPHTKIKVGSKWGQLTILHKLGLDKTGHRYVECLCECGNTAIKRASQLLSGDTKTCGDCPPTNEYEINGETVTGRCSDGTSFFFDYSDFELVKQFQWCNGKGYILSESDRQRVYLHKLILGLHMNSKQIVDHINGIKTDNRRINLRPATSAQNTQNKHCKPRGAVEYRGVDIHTQNKSFRARIGFNGIELHLGCFSTPVLAAQARNIASILLHGEYAGLTNDVPEPNHKLWKQIHEKCKPFLRQGGDVNAI